MNKFAYSYIYKLYICIYIYIYIYLDIYVYKFIYLRGPNRNQHKNNKGMTFIEQTMQPGIQRKIKTCLNTDQTNFEIF